jgi:ribosomal protein S18 acetylase RimI-like enzyme
MDLMPWLACLYVDDAYRNRGYAEQLLNHGLAQTRLKGFDYLYLSTDLINFYERKGWANFGVGYSAFGKEFTIYSKET